MNDVQKCALDILVVVDKVCKEHNIEYFLGYGTFLGAVRHKGFIPWDDDIDIIMKREEYQLFCTKIYKYLPEPYQIIFSKRGRYANYYAKVHNTNTTFIEKTEIADKSRYKGVFIDIFPIDGLPKHNWSLKLYNKIRLVLRRGMTCHNLKDSKLGKISFKEKVACLMPYSIYLSLHEILMKSFKLYNSNLATGEQEKSIFDNIDYYEFEGLKFPGVKDYDAYLKKCYGDYMTLPPEKERLHHDLGAIVNTQKSYKEYINN